jgi:hypothetical protein
MPWLGFFHKMATADSFVVLDSVQYEKNYFQNRNKIRNSSEQGWLWLTVPVLMRGRSSQSIRETKINYSDRRWSKKIWNSIIQNYKSAPYFDEYIERFEPVFNSMEWNTLSDFNLALISIFREVLEIETPMSLASEMGFTSHRSELLAEISVELDASVYLSGPSGRDYLDLAEFEKRHIGVEFHEFHHPEYPQVHGEFMPYMSTLDLVFNCGADASNILFENQAGQ